MRLGVRAENPLELLAIKLNMAPLPVGEAMFGMPMARIVMAGVRLGVFAQAAKAPATVDELASELACTEPGMRLLVDGLHSLGHLDRKGERYSLAKSARPWLDPASDTYVGTFIEHCYDYWRWWDELEEAVRNGKSFEIHEAGPDDPHWRRYIVGQWELARLSAPEVARALELPDRPRGLLDIAGGHGWFAAELCRRHEGLQATVLELPGSAAIGREIIVEAGMSERVRHVEGDMFESDLGGPYDAALCFNIIHHLSPEQNVRLFTRVRESLEPGGVLAVLDLFGNPGERRPNSAAFLALFFYLTSGAATYRPAQLEEWLAEAGFEKPSAKKIKRIPNQTLYQAKAR